MTDPAGGSTTLDCALLRDLFGTEEMRELFSSRALLQGWLDVERALAEAEADAGVIPAWAADRIAEAADAHGFDLDVLREGIAASQHPLVPLLRALASRCGDAGAYVHWGATTQDIVDTGLVLQVRRGLDVIQRDVLRAAGAAGVLAAEHAGTPMAGRTHGQHAVPVTLGFKAATWADELLRAHARLAHARAAASVAQLGGAAGTLASLGADARRVQAAFAGRLGLADPSVPWHAARDRLRDVANALLEVGNAASRVAAEVVRLQSTEVAEVAEPAMPGHVGSSTMPQKRNPMTCEYLLAGASLLRGAVAALDHAGTHAGERDMGAWAVEWVALPQAFILAASVADKLVWVLDGLEVDAGRMRQNLGLSRGAIVAEALMMALARSVGHEEAHRLIHAVTSHAQAAGRSVEEVLAEGAAGPVELPAEAWSVLRDPAAYVGLAPAVAQEVAAAIREADA